MNNTIKGIVDYAKNVGRVVGEAWGDSTTYREGYGMAGGWHESMIDASICAGAFVGANSSEPFQEGSGLPNVRRRPNASVKVGAFQNLRGGSSQAYPDSFKQYGLQIPLRASWGGPQIAFLGEGTLNGAIDGSVTTIVIDTTLAAMLPTTGTSNIRLRVENECILCSGSNLNPATGTITSVTRGNLNGSGPFTAAAPHSNGVRVSIMDNGANVTGLFYPSSGLNCGGNMVGSVWWRSLNAGTVSTASFRQKFSHQENPTNLDSTLTDVVTPGDTAVTGQPIGTLMRDDVEITSSSARSGKVAVCGATNQNGFGPIGPCAILYVSCFNKSSPTGWVMAPGISQGGKRLSELYQDLREYDAALGFCEFDRALVNMYALYRTVNASALGGNGQPVVLATLNCWGHNESSGSIACPVDLSQPWTINVSTLLNEELSDSDTTITLSSTSGLSSANDVVWIDDECIFYTGISGNNLTGCVRGYLGTAPAAHTLNSSVMQGFSSSDPKGFCGWLLFDYKLKLRCWLLAGGKVSEFQYIWCRPTPVTNATTRIGRNEALSGDTNTANRQKEYRFNEYVESAFNFLSVLEGFIVAESTKVMPQDGFFLSTGLGSSLADAVHLSRAGYSLFWKRLVSYYTYGDGSVKTGSAIPGVPDHVVR